jgi:signal transduction histidine kinase
MALANANWQWLLRWRWEAALAACILVSVGVFGFSETGRVRLADSYDDAIRSMWVTERLGDLASRVLEAESAQRGYLLVRRPLYLESYTAALPRIDALRGEIRAHYEKRDARQMQAFDEVSALVATKLGQLERSLKLAQAGRSEVALQQIGSDAGQQSMDRIRASIAALQARERERTSALVEEWRSSLQLSRAGVAAITALNIVLLVLIMRWMKQDWLRARDREQELDRMVQERTTQLANLASYLHDVSETEKTRLGRELHDELGATLTAVKMDVAWTLGKLAPGQATLAEKLQRAARNLDMCIQVKRRIIEDLRPTTLANFGLTTAARELVEQSAERAGWKLQLELPAEDPDLPEETAIALFRILQETLNNAAKYARATTVRISIVAGLGECVVEIEDNGVGFNPRNVRAKASGLIGMKQRVEPHGGRFYVTSQPGKGTLVRVSMPLRKQPAPGETEASRAAPPASEGELFG